MTAVSIILAVVIVLLLRHALRGQSHAFASGHVGKIGERLDLPVTLVDVIAFEKWGRTRHRFRFEDAHGHCFVWWTDIYEVCIPVGACGTARMTVTGHTRYRGTDETIVQNVRVHALTDR